MTKLFLVNNREQLIHFLFCQIILDKNLLKVKVLTSTDYGRPMNPFFIDSVVFLADLSAPIFVQSMFSINEPLSVQKTKAIHPNP